MKFGLDIALNLPQHVVVKVVDGYTVVLAPDYPNWLVLTNEEYQLFSFVKAGLTIRESLEK